MAFWNNIDSYSFFNDRYSGFDLHEIPDQISRIQSLMVRNKSHELVENHFYTLAGAQEMLEGMRYHYRNVLKLKVELGIEVFPNKDVIDSFHHESVAYINRLGQFYHFVTSELIARRIPKLSVLAPTLHNAINFRNKHTAHRSIDKPWDSDTPYTQEQHAISMNKFGGVVWSPKPEVKLSSNKLEMDATKYFLTHQIQLDDGETVLYFSVEKDHPIIMDEAYSVYEAALIGSARI